MTIAARHIDITTEEITCANGMPAFLAYPTGGGKFPTVVLMHERYGLVKHTTRTRRCAARATASRCWRRTSSTSIRTRRCSTPVTAATHGDPESNEPMRAALATLKTHKAADPTKVIVMGYRQTGRHPLVSPPRRRSPPPWWDGAASKRQWDVNKLQPKALEAIIAAVHCPVFGAFGEGDHIISLDDVLRFRNCLEANKKSYDIHIYRGAPHGWLNRLMPGRYLGQGQAGWAARFLAEVFSDHWDGVVRWQFASDSGKDYDFSKNVRME